MAACEAAGDFRLKTSWGDTSRMPADGGTRADSDGKLHIGRVLAPIRALVIEIFSGTKRFSVAISQYAQWQVASWDILEGPEYDS